MKLANSHLCNMVKCVLKYVKNKQNCGTVFSNAYPTPLNKTGLLVGLPTIVVAFSRFSGSATIRVCWKQERLLVNNDMEDWTGEI